ncbi:hypothetical protein Hdeb2414_s0001g00002911 [Helianthus debilis subsp. tardiflorus]
MLLHFSNNFFDLVALGGLSLIPHMYSPRSAMIRAHCPTCSNGGGRCGHPGGGEGLSKPTSTAVTTGFLEGGDADRQNQDIDGVSKVRSIHLPSRWSKSRLGYHRL